MRHCTSNIARWDGTTWRPVGGGINSLVSALACDDKNLYAAGQFTSAGGIAATNIAKWDGSHWVPLGSGIPLVNEGGMMVGAVDSLTVCGSDLFAGGRFRRAGDVFATNIARWEGTNWYALGDGLNGAVRALAAVGRLLFTGGEFRRAGGVAATNVAFWDGSDWHSLGSGVNDGLSVLALTANGHTLFAGGSFRTIGGTVARRIAQWDGVDWSALGSGFGGGLGDAGIGVLAANGAELFAGGFFSNVGGKPSTNIALWHIPHSLNIRRAESQIAVSWPATGTNFIPETKDALDGTSWQPVLQAPAILDDHLVVTNAISSGAGFYRLRRKPW